MFIKYQEKFIKLTRFTEWEIATWISVTKVKSVPKKSLSAKLYAFIFENRSTNNEHNSSFFLKKKEQKPKIPVASLVFLSHIEFAEMQTLKRFEQLFILKHDTERDISLYLVYWWANKFCLKIFTEKKMSPISMPTCVWANVCTMCFWCLLFCYKSHRDTAEVHRWLSPGLWCYD